MATENFQTKLLAIQRNLLNFAYTLTSNREDAYDLLQDTTLKALDNEQKYVDNVNFKGWVFTIMRNLFINKYRRDARSAVIVDQSDDLYMLNVAQDSGRIVIILCNINKNCTFAVNKDCNGKEPLYRVGRVPAARGDGSVF